MRRLRVKKTRRRLVGRVAKCPQLRANCVNHQPLRPLKRHYILPMYPLPIFILALIDYIYNIEKSLNIIIKYIIT